MSCKPQRYLVSNCALGRFITAEATVRHILGTQTRIVEDVSCLSHCYSQLLRCFVALHSRESRGESVCEQSPAFLLSTLDLKRDSVH